MLLARQPKPSPPQHVELPDVPADDVRRLPSAGLHEGQDVDTGRGHVLRRADAGRVARLSDVSAHLIRVACETATGKRPEISIFGEDYDTPDGTCIRDYIHVSDLADAHVLALEYLLQNKKNLILNCGYGRGFSVREVLEVVQKLAGGPMTIRGSERREGDAKELVADSGKIREVLGWEPKRDNLEEIVGSALEWESKFTPDRKQQSNYNLVRLAVSRIAAVGRSLYRKGLKGLVVN